MEDTARRRAELRAEMTALRKAQRDAEAAAPWWELDCPPNMINAASAEHLRDAVERLSHDGLVVVSFFSPECYACRSMQPKLRQIAAGAAGRALFLKVNGFQEGLREFCEAAEITQIPYFHFYRRGALVAQFPANMQPGKLSLLRRTLEEHA